jgi:hypothetical protein
MTAIGLRYLAGIFILWTFVVAVNTSPIPISLHRIDWADAPNDRDTLTILFSCGAALVLCVWTGIHLNLDPNANGRSKDEHIGWVSIMLVKATLASMALLASDIVLTVALHQFLVAWEYRRAVNGFTGTKEMRLKKAFFATMGGFCYEEVTEKGPQWRSLDFDTLLLHKTINTIHEHPLSHIKGKSKASGLAKTIACGQTAWILFQCLGRYLENLHLTPLELNTCVHVVIAIIMYGVWWYKPMDINIPVTVDRHVLIGDSGISTYINNIQSILIRAEGLIVGYISENSSNAGTAAPVRTQPESVKSVNIVIRRESKTPFVFPENLPKTEILTAVAICRSISSTPTDAGQIFRATPAAIKKCLARGTIRDDFKKAVIQKRIQRKGYGPDHEASRPELLAVAFQAASFTASQIVFGVVSDTTSQAVIDAYWSLRNTAASNESEYIEILVEKLSPVLAEALQTIREHAFKAAFRAVQNSSAGNVISSPEAPVAVKTALLEALDSFSLACIASRVPARRAVRQAALTVVVGRHFAAEAAEAALFKFALDVTGTS